MKNLSKITLPTVFALGLLAVGCEKKTTVEVPTDDQHTIVVPVASPVSATKTLETKKLGIAVDNFLATPSDENKADVNKAAADLDGEIAELQQRVATHTGSDKVEAQAKLENLQTYRDQEMARFHAGGVKVDARTGSEKVDDSMHKAGENIQEGAQKVGNSLEKAVDKVGDAIHDATH